MSQHIIKTKDYEIILGWDRMTQASFLTVECLHSNELVIDREFYAKNDEIRTSTKFFSLSVRIFTELLLTLGIIVPVEMYDGLETDILAVSP